MKKKSQKAETAPASGQMSITVRKLANGNLEMFGRHFRLNHRASSEAGEAEFIRRYLEPLHFVQVKPEDVGALTSAPMIQNAAGKVFGYMDYQLHSFVKKLEAGESVIWQAGGVPEVKAQAGSIERTAEDVERFRSDMDRIAKAIAGESSGAWARDLQRLTDMRQQRDDLLAALRELRYCCPPACSGSRLLGALRQADSIIALAERGEA